jgi:Flp pilus assembly protein TadD
VATGKEMIPPFEHQNAVRALAFSPDGSAVLTGSEDSTARVWRIPALSQDATRTKLWTQVLTGTQLDEHGNLNFLETETWQQCRRQFMQSKGGPIWKEENDQTWHRRQAIEAELAGQWFTALWHLDRLLATAPGESQFWKDRADAHAHLEHWNQASLDLRKACKLGEPDLQVWRIHACLLLYLGDAKAYRQGCATLLARWGSTNIPANLNEVALACCLAPRAVANLNRVVQLAEKAVAEHSTNHDTLNTFGAILYRVGQNEEAGKRLQQAISISFEQKGAIFDWLFLAMAQQKLGHTAEAKTCLAKAETLMKAGGMKWPIRLQSQILHREAEAMIKAGKR